MISQWSSLHAPDTDSWTIGRRTLKHFPRLFSGWCREPADEKGHLYRRRFGAVRRCQLNDRARELCRSPGGAARYRRPPPLWRFLRAGRRLPCRLSGQYRVRPAAVRLLLALVTMQGGGWAGGRVDAFSVHATLGVPALSMA